MWSKLQPLFKDVPAYRRGSLEETDLHPESFFVWSETDSEPASFYDSNNHRIVHYLEIEFFSKDAAAVYSRTAEFIHDAMGAGFIAADRGKDCRSHHPAWFGRATNLRYIEVENDINA